MYSQVQVSTDAGTCMEGLQILQSYFTITEIDRFEKTRGELMKEGYPGTCL